MVSIIWVLKIIISIIIDILDFFVGHVIGAKEAWDAFTSILAVVLWGGAGIISIWEMFDVLGAIAPEVPTLTIIGLLSYKRS